MAIEQKFQCCKKCGVGKLLKKDFYKAASTRTGYSRVCKACIREYKRGWIARNLEKHRARNRAWLAANPEKARAIKKASKAANKAKANAYQRAYRARKKLAAIAIDCNPTKAAQGVLKGETP
ncbi:hypothetical protein PQR75_06610 [Paraburkholderia fungorum]|uniref:hypothetical protein n=1 Tax=Paraburkholderia fungorum TaxID=134537 RepID=UPI0038B7781D